MENAFSRPPNFTFQAVRTRAFVDFAEKDRRAKITAVLAPPGFGKTILLSEMYRQVEREGERAIWLGADAHAGKGTSFLFELERRLLRPEPAFGEAFAYQQKPSVRERIERVIAALQAGPGQIFLIFDNGDLGDPTETQQLLDALAFETPDRVRLVVSSSTKTPFDATRALLELRLKTYTASELGFGLAEIHHLFDEAGVSDLEPAMADKLLRLSEGWPAAVRLMQVLASTGGGPPASESEGWTGEGLLDTLFARLMNRLEPELQTFLLEASTFSVFTEELLGAATQSPRAASFLHYLVENNVLIASDSERKGSFRLHGLFRRYLARLAADRLPPERQRQVAIRGAQWLEREERIAESLELALTANEAGMATRLLEKLSWTMVRRAGNLASFTSLVERARARGVALGSEARFWYLWTLIFDRRYDEATRELDSFAADLQNTTCSEERRAMLRAKVGLAGIVLKLHLDDMAAIRSLAPAWLTDHAEQDRFETGATAGALALAQTAELDFTAGQKSARLSIASVSPSASLYGKAWAKNIWAHLELMQGNAREVAARMLELEDTIHCEIGQETAIGAVATIVRANALHHLGQEREIIQSTESSLTLAARSGLLDFVWLGMEILLPTATQAEAGWENLDLLYEIAERYPPRLTRMLDWSRIRLLSHGNRLEAAVHLAGKIGIWKNGQIEPSGLATGAEALAFDLTAISLMTLAGDQDKAAERIEAGLHAAKQSNNRRAWIEYLLARSSLNWRTGRVHEAAGAFGRAVMLASETGWKSPFLQQAQLVKQIARATSLKQIGLVTQASRVFLSEITELPQAPSGQSDILDTPAEGLTKREVSLLHLLSEGKDNAQIAADADIAVRTVKWHLRNLYAKLNVKNRTSALARAREIGIL